MTNQQEIIATITLKIHSLPSYEPRAQVIGSYDNVIYFSLKSKLSDKPQIKAEKVNQKYCFPLQKYTKNFTKWKDNNVIH